MIITPLVLVVLRIMIGDRCLCFGTSCVPFTAFLTGRLLPSVGRAGLVRRRQRPTLPSRQAPVRLEASSGGRHVRTSEEQNGSSGSKAEVELRSERAGWPRPFLNRNNPPPQWIHPPQSTSPVWFSVNAEESGHDIL